MRKKVHELSQKKSCELCACMIFIIFWKSPEFLLFMAQGYQFAKMNEFDLCTYSRCLKKRWYLISTEYFDDGFEKFLRKFCYMRNSKHASHYFFPSLSRPFVSNSRFLDFQITWFFFTTMPSCLTLLFFLSCFSENKSPFYFWHIKLKSELLFSR